MSRLRSRWAVTACLLSAEFAVNMWTRAITSSPQLTTYYLGFRQISGLYSDWRAAQPDAPPKDFADRMMSLGAVDVEHYGPLLELSGQSP